MSISNENFNVAREYLHNVYVPKKLEKHIYTRLLISDSPDARDVQKRDFEALRETRIMSENLFTPHSYVTIWVDKVSFTVWDNGLDTIVITSLSIATTMRQIFEHMWHNASSMKK